MTRMIPSHPGPSATRSESEVFGIIRDAPNSDMFVCLHSVGLAEHPRKEYAEIDFVLIGPPGVFCLEVKGGQVRRENGTWRIGWPGKQYLSSEGPFKQAQSARWSLLEHLRTRLGTAWPVNTCVGWGVILPDVTFAEQDPEWDLDVVFDERDKNDSFLKYVNRLSAYYDRRREATGRRPATKLGPTPQQKIVECLRGNFDAVPSLSGLIGESSRELVALSEDQYRVLDYALEPNLRILCDGVAGSGKTLVAVEAAKRLARRGARVLMVCYNDALGRFLQLDFAGQAGIEVRTLYGFLRRVIVDAGLGPDLNSIRATANETDYFSAFPNLFERACAILVDQDSLPQFDVIVVDEAQDILSTALMNCLDLVLSGGFSKGRWAVFLDSGIQSGIYGRVDSAVLERLRSFAPATFLLSENFRNPKGVVVETCAVTGAAMPRCRRSMRSTVDYRLAESEEDQARKLRALLVELLRSGVRPADITILSGCALSASAAAVVAKVGSPAISLISSSERTEDRSHITASTVSSFKGLENEVIILTNLPTLDRGSPWVTGVFYVGMTRARTKLYAFVDSKFIATRERHP